ncbi:hypothetical protein [Mesobaculum littorinae]|nr:hypothetical protein [Mesobaculum littorinae]
MTGLGRIWARLFLSRRLSQAERRNRDAAERLDAALRELWPL